MKTCNTCKISKDNEEFVHKYMCKPCQKLYMKQYYIENKTNILKKCKSYYKENKTKIKNRDKENYLKNKEKILSNCKVKYKKNKSEILLKSKNYYNENKNKVNKRNQENYKKNIVTVRQRHSQWEKDNKEIRRSIFAKRRAAKLQRTPKWVDLQKIQEVYKNCPKGMHVDHIVPLQGKNVSGLHVHWNLQYLTASENCKKGNRF